MNDLPQEFNVNTYIKPGFDLIIELDDVEYLIDMQAVAAIKDNESTIALKRLIDGGVKIASIEQIIKVLQAKGPLDYLEIR